MNTQMEPKVTKVVIFPSWVSSVGAVRAVELSDGSARTEQFEVGKGWIPSTVPVGEVATAPALSESKAQELGIKVDELN